MEKIFQLEADDPIFEFFNFNSAGKTYIKDEIVLINLS